MRIKILKVYLSCCSKELKIIQQCTYTTQRVKNEIKFNSSPITQELYFYSKNVQNLLPVLGFEEYYFLIAFFFSNFRV